MRSRRQRLLVLLALAASPGALSCASSFVPLRVSDALTATAGALRADVRGVWLTDDVPLEGIGDDAALVVELELRNDGAQPASVSATSFACLMEIDAARPSETLSLLPGGGDEGAFPGEMPGERAVLAPMVIPPGQKRLYWALFRGYRFPASEVPRRITLRIPAPDGLSLEVALADPARGKLRWSIEPPSGGFTVGLLNTSLYSDHLHASVVSTQLSRLTRAWRLLWEVGLATSVLVQTNGALRSSTSSFVGSGLAGRVSAPITMWGTTREPREIGFYVGGTALVLLETQVQQPTDNPATPSVYGALTAEVGLELDIGAVHLAGTPFPLSQIGRALPRWSVRLGYTHWRVGGGGSDGYVSGLRLAW